MDPVVETALEPSVEAVIKPAPEPGFDVVTGAFSYTGRHIARRLLAQERRVRTLTRRPQPPGTEDIKVDIAPLQFTDRAALVESLRGADVLYNTYWVRFRHGKVGFGEAVANTRMLVGAAAEAGVHKVVHISVSNPSIDSPLDYYAGKARTEEIVRSSGLRWSIIRPTLVFGTGDILINNIAWLLRRMPIFPIQGLGGYRVQPVAVEDVAELATWAAEQSDNITVDAAGPDTVTYGEFVEGIAIAVGRRPRFIYTSPRLTLFAGNIVASRQRDVMLTQQELQGLMEDLLVSHEKPRGTRRMDNWLLSNAATLGRTYP